MPHWLRLPGVALFLVLLGFALLTTSGHTYSSDEETMLAVAESLVQRGSFALAPDFLMNYAAGGRDGERFSRYGAGQSLLLVPFVAAGHALAPLFPAHADDFVLRLVVLVLPAIVTAATGVVLYAWVRAMGYTVRVALLVGLLYGLTSLAVPYSRTLFAEPTATFLLVLCGYAIRHEHVRWWLVAGASAGAALAVKTQVALALPVLALYALSISWQPTWTATLRQAGGRALAGLAGLAVPLGLLLLYNWSIFGSPFTSGYGSLDPTSELNTPFQHGAYGLLLSPGKGLLVFAPTVLLGFVGMLVGGRQQGRESVLALLLLLVHVAFYARLDYWHGDGSWGPRYLVFVVPFLYLPAAGLLARLAAPRWRLARAAVASVAVVGLVVQLIPMLFNMGTYLQLTGQGERYFTWHGSPIVGHARMWLHRADEWLLHVAPRPGTVVLRDGFSYSEGDRKAGDVLPRWSYATGRIQVVPHATDAPLEVRLVVGDHRPYPLARAEFALLHNEQPLANVQRTDLHGDGITWELTATLPKTDGAQWLTLQSDTWNPTQATDDNPRNENLGLLVQEVAATQSGQPLVLREALPIPTVPDGRRALWLWYYDTPQHHLFDVWWWYVLVAGLPAAAVALLLLLIGAPALLMITAGVWGIRAAWQGQPATAAT